MTITPTSAKPADTMPLYQADEDHDGKTVAAASAEVVVHPEPDQPATDPQAGSGKLDMGDEHDGAGGDGRKHNSA